MPFEEETVGDVTASVSTRGLMLLAEGFRARIAFERIGT
jgi:hypothetical protein